MRSLLTWLCCALVDAPAAEVAPPPGPTIVSITLQPATTPRPTLKYHLVPEQYGLIAGNAATFYHRAMLMIAGRQNEEAWQPHSKTGPAKLSFDEQLSAWLDVRAAHLPREEVRALLNRFASIIREIELGANRDHCDWEFARRDEGINLLIPEIQNSRTLARLISLQARLAIADGRLEAALQSIQTGMTLARHVATGPTLIQTLVGDAIAFTMASCLEDLIGAPGAPSLFWALADRPRPFVDLRLAFESERHIVEKEFPALLDLDKGVWSLDQTRRVADSLQEKLFDIASGYPIPEWNASVPSHLPPTSRRLILATMCARIEPEARRALIQAGRSPAEVATLPVIQAALLYVYGQSRERRDAMFKWANVPYASSANEFKPVPLTAAERRANPLLAIFALLEEGYGPSRLAAVRVDRQLDILQVVEAIRLDATRHEGRLPASLDAIKDLPIPLDQATGKSFEYRVHGDSATLIAPSLAEVQFTPAITIQIELTPPKR